MAGTDKVDKYYADSTARIADQGNVSAGWICEDNDTGSRYRRTSSGWTQVHSAGAALSYDRFDQPAFGETLGFSLLNGGVAFAAGAAPTITAANIPYVNNIPAGRRRLIARCAVAEDETAKSHSILGMLFAINAGNAFLAKERAENFLDPAKQHLQMTASAATGRSGDSGVLFLPAGGDIDAVLDEDISDVYAIPVANDTSPVGNLQGSLTLAEVPA